VNGKCRITGFTLIELLVVMALVAVLASFVAPMVATSVTHAKESALRENLHLLRKTLDDYYADKGVYPVSLTQLVNEHYLRNIPEDTVTNKEWSVVYSDDTPQGIIDIHSQSDELANDGTPYASW